ncbi:MAG: hypothetical protein ACJAQ4_001609 [Cryomorphaceae bacterium]|jgi:hypothetical protein
MTFCFGGVASDHAVKDESKVFIFKVKLIRYPFIAVYETIWIEKSLARTDRIIFYLVRVASGHVVKDVLNVVVFF